MLLSLRMILRRPLSSTAKVSTAASCSVIHHPYPAPYSFIRRKRTIGFQHLVRPLHFGAYRAACSICQQKCNGVVVQQPSTRKPRGLELANGGQGGVTLPIHVYSCEPMVPTDSVRVLLRRGAAKEALLLGRLARSKSSNGLLH